MTEKSYPDSYNYDGQTISWEEWLKIKAKIEKEEKDGENKEGD